MFKALSNAGTVSSQDLADRTNLNERYVREWLRAMVATEYVEYDHQTDRYFMDEEQSTVLASEDSALFVGGSLRFTIPSLYNVPRIIDAFRRGAVFRIPNSAATCPVPSSASSVRVTSTNS